MIAIETKNLKKQFKDMIAVQSLNLTIEEGELFGLLGVNGAGKTTTIRMLSCLSRPTSGEAFVFGKNVETETNEVKKLINLSTQETAVATSLTVKENLEFAAQIYGSCKKDAIEKTQNIMEELSLTEFANKRVKLLSGGWQRRLSIAMALITEPKVLYLDEPTLGLDVLARRELWSVINSLKGKVTIILTTHYLEEAEALCDRIAIMVKGEIKALGTSEELKEQAGKDNFEDAFIEIAKGGDHE